MDQVGLQVEGSLSARARRLARRDEISKKQLKNLIWVYLVLLIFEGALRKWVFPALANPLLIVRDPIAIWLVIIAWRRGIFGSNIYFTVMVLIGAFSMVTAVLIGHGNILVALFGARVLILHFPLIFIIGNVFDRQDILKIAKFFLWTSIPMTVLLVAQFYSPQSAWVNRGIGGDIAGSGFAGALGYYRSSGTFSFTSGISLFYNVTACFIFYFWLAPRHLINRLLLIISSFALIIAIPTSISRSLFFSVIFTLIFVVLAILRKPKFLKRIIIVALVAVTAFAIVSQLGIFQTATEVFSRRFTDASDAEGGLKGTFVDRYLGGMASSIEYYSEGGADLPFFGYGIGMGTNVGSSLLTGQVSFLVSEGEWGRLIGELGFFMGFTVIFVRIAITVKIATESYRRLKLGDLLPWILVSFCILIIPQGQWSQPTSLGFCVVAAGFTIASMRSSKSPA